MSFQVVLEDYGPAEEDEAQEPWLRSVSCCWFSFGREHVSIMRGKRGWEVHWQNRGDLLPDGTFAQDPRGYVHQGRAAFPSIDAAFTACVVASGLTGNPGRFRTEQLSLGMEEQR